MSTDLLDAAYDRLLSTGPEYGGFLSNHGPMAVEALARHDHGDAIAPWLDHYSARLEDAPHPAHRIANWKEALGDARRVGDWLGWFDEELRESAWTEVLRVWWPRLLPGIAAGATHGVIRVGHAVRSLREDGTSPTRQQELSQALAYWAARWQPVPGAATPTGRLTAADAVRALPTLPRQTGGVGSRLGQLALNDGWTDAQRALRPPVDAAHFLRDVVAAAVRRYATHAHGNAVMLVHAATAPNAVLRVLPSLPREQWRASANAAWSASAAIQVAYATPDARRLPTSPPTTVEAFDRAAHHGDEHVIKLADTALDAYGWTRDDTTLAAVATATELIDPL